MRKDIFHCAWDNTRLSVCTCEGESLSGGGLAIGEDNSVVAFHGGRDVASCRSGIDRFVVCAGEDFVIVIFGDRCAGRFMILGNEL